MNYIGHVKTKYRKRRNIFLDKIESIPVNVGYYHYEVSDVARPGSDAYILVGVEMKCRNIKGNPVVEAFVISNDLKYVWRMKNKNPLGSEVEITYEPYEVPTVRQVKTWLRKHFDAYGPQ